MEFNKETIRNLRGLILFTLLLLVGLWRFDVVWHAFRFLLGVLSPLLFGGAIAFVLSVPMKQIQKAFFGTVKKGSKQEKAVIPLSFLLSLVLVFALFSLVVAVVLPELGNTISTLSQTIPEKVPLLLEKLEGLFITNPHWIAYIEAVEASLNWEEIFEQFLHFFRFGANTMLGSTISAAKGIVSGLTTFVIAFTFACYILLQGETLGRQCRKLFYAVLKVHHADEVVRICSLTYRTFSNFLTGQCLEAVILGLMFFVVMTLFRFPFAVLVGVLIAFTALIPIFGAFIGCAVGAFLILTVNPPQALAFILLFLVLQQIEGNLIYPKVVGSSIGLPSLWVLAAVSLGGSLFGIIGMLVFIPILSVLYTLLREFVNKRLQEKNLQIH